MRIAINTRLLLKNKLEGIGWFTYQTLSRLTNKYLQHEFIFFFDRPYDKEFVFALNVHPVALFPPSRHPLLWYWYFEHSIPRALHKYKPDIYVSMDGFGILKNVDVPILNIIHDINFEHHPEFIENKGHRAFYKNFAHRYAEKSTRIGTVSNYSKQDIVETYRIPEAKIDVIYNGVNDSFHPITALQKEAIKKTHTQGCPYFVYVGSLHKRKNIVNTLQAFDIYKERDNNNFKFLLVGNKMWDTHDIDEQLNKMNHRDDVIFLNHLSPKDLNDIVASAEALLYPSLFEGFGVPIIEAFACGTPVITSNVTSMPEIAGDAAIYCTPQDPENIANAIQKLMRDPGLREQLIQKGFERKELFNWDKSSDALWTSINKTINQ